MLTFLPAVSYPTGTNAAGIAVGDVNGDSQEDLAVVDQTSATVGILINAGNGTFQLAGSFAAGSGAIDAALGDFNADGHLDLGVVGTASVNILLGNGDGTFGAPVSYPVGSGSHSINKGDFNGDGQLDLATMNYGSASVLLGNGDGTFQVRLDLAIPGNSTNTVVGDFNRDGFMDLATSNTASLGTITVLRGHGDGSFDPAASYYAFSAPVYLAAGDFNHDGFDDFAVANSYAATSMSVIMNNGDGTYAAPQTYGIAQTGYEIEVEDFDGDGNVDFAVRGSSQYMVQLGKGDGTFYPEVNYQTPAGRFEMGTHGDFNHDGAVDFAYPSTSGVTVVLNANDTVVNLSTAVGFTVSAPVATTSGSLLPVTVTVVDADGNAVPDFLGTVYLSSSDPAVTAPISYRFAATDAGVHTITGNMRLSTLGQQTVTVSTPLLPAASTTVNVTPAITKFDVSAPAVSVAGDVFPITVTALDALGGVGSGYTSTVHFNSSDVLAGLPADYTFTPDDAGVHSFTVTLKSSGARLVDVAEVGRNVHGDALVQVSSAAATSLQLAGAGGAIGVARPITVVGRDVYGNLATGYNGTVHFSSSDPSALLPGDTTLTNGQATVNVTYFTVGTQTVTATDVADASIYGSIASDATPPVPALFDVSDYPATTAGVAQGFTVTVRDTIGQVANGYTRTVYFTSSDQQAGLPASYTFNVADAGVHTFAATLRTAGTQSITVRDLAGGLVGSQVGIDVVPADFARFHVSVPNPTDSKGHVLLTAGDAISLTVDAIDAFGNSVTGYRGTVTFASTDSQAALPADYAFTAADAGSHTFNVALKTVTPNGVVWSFSVADVANSATVSTLTNFEVVNAAAATFTLAVPTKITAGDSFTVKLDVQDAYGNRAKNYFGTVHLGVNSGAADLPADYTYNADDAGSHDFVITLFTSGNQLVTVDDTIVAALAASTGASVTPAAASAVHLSFPSTTTAGDIQNLTVTVVDAYGNVASGYRGTVDFSSSDQQAGLPASYTLTNKDAGVHTFPATLKSAGNQSITVTDHANSTIAATQSAINVTPSAVAGSFVVSGFLATTAGLAQSFTVTVKDLFGNVSTGYVGKVTFSSSDSQADLPASYSFTAADAGSHTFTAVLKTAGSQSLSIKDAANSAATGSQKGIVVASATATSLSVSGFPATTAGDAQKFTVTARDAFGNVSVGYAGTIMFSSSDALADLPGNYTFTSTDAGVHAFTATLKKAGTQSITATDKDSRLVLGSQAGISVVAGAAASFSISTPNTVTQGVGFKLTLTVLDAYGNVATGYRGKVRLSSNDPKAGKTDFTFSASDNGSHVFSYTLNTLGIQPLTFADTANSTLLGKVNVNVVPK